MNKIRRFFAVVLLWVGAGSRAATIYSEDFSHPTKLSNSGATAELGNGGDYAYGTWIYAGGNMGVNDPAEGNGSGASNGNAISSLGLGRPQDERGTNARALSIVLSGRRFTSGVEYTVSFDVIGDAAGNNAGRYWLALVSGIDAENGVLIDGTHAGWGASAGSPKPFRASGIGNATVNYIADSGSNGVLINGEDGAGTTPVSFTFIHDGVSDVAFAVGTYNNIFAVDNVRIDDPNAGNILPEVAVGGDFGKYMEIAEGDSPALEIFASDADGSVTNIQVFVDDVQIDQNTATNEYVLLNAFAGIASGARELSVVVTDDAGGVGRYSRPFYIIPADGELTGQHPYTAGRSKVTEYLRFVPDAYNTNTNKQWPLILWLHGAGNRGDDATRLLAAGGPPSRIKNNDPLLDDFIVLSPQCVEGAWWSGNAEQNQIDALLDEHIARFRVDPDRVIITGQSMGGYGTWEAVKRHPNKYAAAVPICGGGDPSKVASFARLPIKIFHGDADTVVPYRLSVDMFDALEAAGARNSTFHTITNGPHNVWTETYKRADLYEWMRLMSWLPKYYPEAEAWEPLFDQDTDRDGMTSREELDAGTSPSDPTSVFVCHPPTDDGVLRWNVVPERRYAVFASTNLNEGWFAFAADLAGDVSGTNALPARLEARSVFYRVETSR